MQKNFFKKIILITLFVAMDLIVKAILDGKSVAVLNGFFRFESSHNYGASWSILQGYTLVFILGAIIFVIAMSLFDYFSKLDNKWYFWGYCLMLAGTIGNLVDRIVFGYVRDFIFLEFINFPIFNLADAFLTVGTVLFCVYVLFIYKEPKKEVKND